MLVSAQSSSNIAEPPWPRRSVPRPAKTHGFPLYYLACLAAIAGLLASGSSPRDIGALRGIAAAAQPATLTGQLLVARTELRDPRFIRSVVYLVHHAAGGAMGLILNRPIGEASLSELLKQAGLESTGVNGEIRVHFGGPVQPGLGFVLHTADYKI